MPWQANPPTDVMCHMLISWDIDLGFSWTGRPKAPPLFLSLRSLNVPAAQRWEDLSDIQHQKLMRERTDLRFCTLSLQGEIKASGPQTRASRFRDIVEHLHPGACPGVLCAQERARPSLF